MGVDRAVKNRLYDDILALPPQGAIAAARALAARGDYRPMLPQIDCPTLVVAGAEDSVTSPETMHHIHAQVPGSRYAVIEKAAHLPPAEQPQAFASVLLSFLTQL
jgi:pimeloyl-ACP methyl ester carboxylesterase